MTGNKKPRSKSLEVPGVDASGAAASNNNAGIPQVPQGNGWRSVVDANGNLTLGAGKTLTLNAGTYYLNDLTLNGQSTLNFNGKAVLYLTGDLNTAGGSMVNTSQVPGNLQIYMTGGSATVRSFK